MNIASESTQVCSTDSPAAVATAPNDSAYAPVATPMPGGVAQHRGANARASPPPRCVSIAPTLPCGAGPAEWRRPARLWLHGARS